MVSCFWMVSVTNLPQVSSLQKENHCRTLWVMCGVPYVHLGHRANRTCCTASSVHVECDSPSSAHLLLIFNKMIFESCQWAFHSMPTPKLPWGFSTILCIHVDSTCSRMIIHYSSWISHHIVWMVVTAAKDTVHTFLPTALGRKLSRFEQKLTWIKWKNSCSSRKYYSLGIDAV